MTITELEQAVTQLSEQELSRFREWFDEYFAEIWDKQIEEDARAGRLDKLIAEVNEEINDLSIIEERRNEPSQPLHEHLKEKAGAKW